MRTLLLLRHAKSSWDDAHLPDYERPLTRRGERAARRMAQHLRAENIQPNVVLCSPARRAADTFALVKSGFGEDADVRVEDDFYGAAAGDVLQKLKRLADGVSCAMVVGHNPTMHDLATALAGDGDEVAMADLRDDFPTCALAMLDLGDTTWGDLGRGDAYLSRFVLPRRLGD